MSSKISTALTVTTLLCSAAFAFHLNGSVSDVDGAAIQGASIALLKNGLTTLSDENGEFSLQSEASTSTAFQTKPIEKSFQFSNGVLNFTSDNSTPLHVKIFDLMGNKIASKNLHASGSLDLSTLINTQGSYIARIHLGNQHEIFRFNANGSHSSIIAKGESQNYALTANTGSDTLQVVATGYDTLSLELSNLDTTLDLTLSKTATEQTYAFGYALKNTPRPSLGCGKNSTLQSVSSNSNALKYSMTSADLEREYWVTLPKNYDNTKPYKILFAMHCMGSSAEDFTNHTPDQDHPSPYYGQQVLDENDDYIFVAPQGGTDGMPWRTDDNKDHIFFDELLTLLENNYCIDTSRVFVTGFSFGSMYTNSLAQVFQHRIRAVAVYAVADWNIYIPENAGKPIAWMDVHGTQDNLCSYSHVDSSVDRILANNGPNGTDVRGQETAEKYSGGNTHVCYDFKSVDPRFPVKLCTWGGAHQWTAYDSGNWENTWVPETVHEFFEQF